VIPPGCEALLSNAQVAAALSVSVRKVQEMISAGEFPRCDFRIGDSPRWRVGTVNAWVEARAASPKG
jgi:predicted DNA-binding transcriptional regulator AlpA